jgi:hypothetical protein
VSQSYFKNVVEVMAPLLLKSVNIATSHFRGTNDLATLCKTVLKLAVVDICLPLVNFYRSIQHGSLLGNLISSMKESLSKALASYNRQRRNWVQIYDNRQRERQFTDEEVPSSKGYAHEEMASMEEGGGFRYALEFSCLELLDSKTYHQVDNLRTQSVNTILELL